MPAWFVRFAAGVGRRVLLWFVAAVVITLLRHAWVAFRLHH